MTRIMYDSVSPRAIPRDAKMVAGYIDGRYAWSAADWGLFPSAVHVPITALGRDDGIVLNLEPNGYWPSDLGVGWVRARRAKGVDPTIYLNYRNHLHLVRAAFDRAREPHPHFWVAEYNGVANIPPGTVAKQFAAPEGTGAAKSPGHYDISVVVDFWPGIDQPKEEKVTDDEANMIADKVYAKIMDTRIDRSSTEGDPPQSGNFPLRWLFAALDGHITGIKARIAELKDRIVNLDAKVDQISTGGVSEERIGEIAVEAVRTEMTD